MAPGQFMSLYEMEKPGLPEIGAYLLSFNLPSKPICGGLSTDFLQGELHRGRCGVGKYRGRGEHQK